MFDEDDDDSGTIFRDFLLLMFSGFAALLVMAISQIADAKKTSEGNTTRAGVQVVAQWPDDIDADVDLWVQAPGDLPVGYSNKGAAFFNLLRDDLGRQLDTGKANFEIAQSRGIPPGNYTVNLHLYRNSSKLTKIPVTVVVSTQVSDGARREDILTTNVELDRDGQEITALRFDLSPTGSLVAGSVNTVFKALRSGGKP